MANTLMISFSGGETSALMTHLLVGSNEVRQHYDNIVVTFANTGAENEETLEFVRRCQDHFGWPVRWVEARFDPTMGVGVTGVETCYEIAYRDNEPFEALIAKHGIPNNLRPFCSKELKQRALRSFMRRLGHPTGTYDTAIGIRADEFDRVAPDAAKMRVVYPLIARWKMTKPQVNAWWAGQPFRLGLKGYQGNCRTCWKKSLRKLLTIMDETPEAFDFMERMEAQHGLVGPEFRKEHRPGYRRTFFRDNRSVADLRALLAQQKNSGTFVPAADDSLWLDPTLDGAEGGCAEACDAFSTDDDDPLA